MDSIAVSVPAPSICRVCQARPVASVSQSGVCTDCQFRAVLAELDEAMTEARWQFGPERADLLRGAE